jgi:signal transduction histidine kinase
VGFVGLARLPRPSGATSGHGLPSMQERAEALGGRVTVHHQGARGTRIQVHVPLSGAAA